MNKVVQNALSQNVSSKLSQKSNDAIQELKNACNEYKNFRKEHPKMDANHHLQHFAEALYNKAEELRVAPKGVSASSHRDNMLAALKFYLSQKSEWESQNPGKSYEMPFPDPSTYYSINSLRLQTFVPMPTFGNTIGVRALNPFAWIDATAGTLLEGYARFNCAIINGLARGVGYLTGTKDAQNRLPAQILKGIFVAPVVAAKTATYGLSMVFSGSNGYKEIKQHFIGAIGDVLIPHEKRVETEKAKQREMERMADSPKTKAKRMKGRSKSVASGLQQVSSTAVVTVATLAASSEQGSSLPRGSNQRQSTPDVTIHISQPSTPMVSPLTLSSHRRESEFRKLPGQPDSPHVDSDQGTKYEVKGSPDGRRNGPRG